jgi:hypothetical protein
MGAAAGWREVSGSLEISMDVASRRAWEMARSLE